MSPQNTILILRKVDYYGYDVSTIVTNGSSTNSKLIRILLESEIRKLYNKGKKILEMKFDHYFNCKGKKHFALFYLIYILKCIRNALCEKDNFFIS